MPSNTLEKETEVDKIDKFLSSKNISLCIDTLNIFTHLRTFLFKKKEERKACRLILDSTYFPASFLSFFFVG